MLPLQRACIYPWSQELKHHLLHGVAKKKKRITIFSFLPLSIFRLFVDFLLGCTFSFQKYREYILTKVYLDSNSMLALEIISLFSSLGTM